MKQNWLVTAGDGVSVTDTFGAESCQSEPVDGNGELLIETEGGGANPSSELDTPGEVDRETEWKRAGPYRARYDETKKLAAENHPEWLRCGKCDGTGKNERKKCSNCKGSGEVWMHCHRHAMLLATKLLLKNLWIEWNRQDGEAAFETEAASAVLAGSVL